MNTRSDSNTVSDCQSSCSEGTIKLRVRYQETDQMGVVYHGNYFTWFEMGRTELLRTAYGVDYRSLEKSTVMFAIISAECSYKKPAKYDDILTLKTRVVHLSRVTIEHEYHLFRGEELLAVGHTVLASLDVKTGRPCAVPAFMYETSRSADPKESHEASNECF